MLGLRERSQWLARNVLPHESGLRAKLRCIRTFDLDLEDIIQETYARILAVDALEAIRSPQRYAYLTARAIIVDHIRHSRVISIASGVALDFLDVIEPSAGALERLELLDQVGEVVAALARLPELTREILIMRRVECVSQKDVACRLGISEKTVEKHMAKGAGLLLKLFGRGGKTQFRMSNRKPEIPDNLPLVHCRQTADLAAALY